MDFQSAKSFGKLRLRAFQPYHLYYICRHCRYKTRISNAFNAIYVDTVDTKHIHTFLLITLLIFNGFSIRKKFWKAGTQGFSTIPSILYMSTLSIQFSHFIVLCIRCHVRATNTSVDSVDKHSIKCIACFDLHIDSVDKKDTLLNTQ